MRSSLALFLTLALAESTVAAAQQAAQPPAIQSQPAAEPQTAAFSSARSLVERGKFDEGIAELKALEARDPNLPGLARELGNAYYKNRDFIQATSYFKRALQADPDDQETVQLLGLSYYFNGRPGEAIPLLEKVQSWYPRANVDAAYVLGICYIQTRDYDKARKAFAHMYGVNPESAASHLFLARMLLRQEFEPVAIEEAQKAVSIDPRLPKAHFLLGELYVFKSQIPEATAEFQKELAINPMDAATYYKLADAYSRVMKWEDAERLLQRSIWLDATASGPYILLGKVLLKKGEAALAEGYLRRALEMDPNNYIAHHLLGEIYRAMGRNDEAQREAQLAERLQSAQHPKLENPK